MTFNITNDADEYLCPCCGLPGYFDGQSYEGDRPHIGTGICPCCMFEPGFDDDPMASGDAKPTILASILHYREKWIAMGMPWRGKADYWFAKPSDWDATAQLDALYACAPELKS